MGIKDVISLASLTKSTAAQAAYGENHTALEQTECPTCRRWYLIAEGHDCPDIQQR